MLFQLKGQPDTFKDVEITVECARPHVSYTPIVGPGCHGVFDPDRVAIVRGEDVVEQRTDRRGASGVRLHITFPPDVPTHYPAH